MGGSEECEELEKAACTGRFFSGSAFEGVPSMEELHGDKVTETAKVSRMWVRSHAYRYMAFFFFFFALAGHWVFSEELM